MDYDSRTCSTVRALVALSLVLALLGVHRLIPRRAVVSTSAATAGGAASSSSRLPALPITPVSPPFVRAFYINADGSSRRRDFMETQLRQAGVRFERWRALPGTPALLQTHRAYFDRGVEAHLFVNHSVASGVIEKWGTVSTYLSHHTLFEHIVRVWGANSSSSFLILQDDTQLKRNWLQMLSQELRLVNPDWARLLLVWWGLARKQACNGHFCVVKPPAGPTEKGPECCGKRFYHGLQAWLVRIRSLRCLLRRLKRRHIKNIDAQMVQCNW